MPIFGWFDTAEADQFARAIAEDLMGRIPAPSEYAGKKQSPERMQNAQHAIIVRAQAFARTHKLNWYRKAHLGNTFRWVLLESGYDKAFVDTWTQQVMVAVTAPNAAQKSP